MSPFLSSSLDVHETLYKGNSDVPGVGVGAKVTAWVRDIGLGLGLGLALSLVVGVPLPLGLGPR